MTMKINKKNSLFSRSKRERADQSCNHSDVPHFDAIAYEAALEVLG